MVWQICAHSMGDLHMFEVFDRLLCIINQRDTYFDYWGKGTQVTVTSVCHCDWAFDYWGKGTSVTVTSGVQTPPKSLVGVSACAPSSDGFLTLGCVTSGFTPAEPLKFKWTGGVTDMVQYPAVQQGGTYTAVSHARVKATDWNAEKTFTCEAEHPGTPKHKPVELKKQSVPVQAPILLLTTPTQADLDNGTATFICVASQFSPKEYKLTWTLDQREITDRAKPTILTEEKSTITMYTAISILEILASEWVDTLSTIKCEVKHHDKTFTKEAKYEPTSMDVTEKVEIIPPSTEDMLVRGVGELQCHAQGRPGFKGIRWMRDGQTLASEVQGQVDGSSFTAILKIDYHDWSKGTEYICEVEHTLFAELKKTYTYSRKNGEEKTCPSVYLLAPPEHGQEREVTLTCYVKSFYPKDLVVYWLANDKILNSTEDDSIPYQHRTSCPIEVEKDRLYSIYSQLVISSAEWETGTVFTCLVYHEAINPTVRTISRSLDSVSGKPTVVSLTMSVPSTPACASFTDCMVLTEMFCKEPKETDWSVETEDSNMENTALTFVFLFLITLIYCIGATIVKFLFPLFIAVPVVEPNISVLSKEDENNVKLVCLLDGFTPDNKNVTWFMDKKELTVTGRTLKSQGQKEGKPVEIFTHISEILVGADELEKGTKYTCEASHSSKNYVATWTSCKAHPSAKPLIHLEKPRLSDPSLQPDSVVTASCVVKAALSSVISWVLNGNEEKKASAEQKKRQTSSTELTVSNLTLSAREWEQLHSITCRVKQPCDEKPEEKTVNGLESAEKDLTVEIRRPLWDVLNGDGAVLECSARNVPSGELSVTFQANQTLLGQVQYVDLPKGQNSLTTRITVPVQHREKDNSFTCKVQQSPSKQWTSDPTGKIFGDPSVELLLVPSAGKSEPQKLLCTGTGFKPEIKWLPNSGKGPVVPSKAMIQADGRMKSVHSVISWVLNGNEEKKASAEQKNRQTSSTELTVSNLTLSAREWEQLQSITCRVKQPCDEKPEEKTVNGLESAEKDLTVEIRRPLWDVLNGDGAVLECSARNVPSGELSVTFQANQTLLGQVQYVDLPKGQNSLTARITVPAQHREKDNSFTCKVQQSPSKQWTSDPTGKIFAHPSAKPLIHLEKPRLSDPSLQPDSVVTASCVVEAVLSSIISWVLNGNEEKKASAEQKDRQPSSSTELTVSNLTLSAREWEQLHSITCRVKQPCDEKPEEKTVNGLESAEKDLTVEIRRPLSDNLNGDGAVLECSARNVPSGELSVTFQANQTLLGQVQYVDLPKGQNSLTARITVPAQHREKDNSFTCKVQQSPSKQWTSDPTGKIFGDPSMDLSLVPSVRKSEPQKLLCTGTGFKPEIKWLPNSGKGPDVPSKAMIQADGRMKVFSEMDLSLEEWNEGKEFTCQVTDLKKTIKENISACAVTAPFAQLAQVYLLGPSLSDMRSADVPLTCLVTGHRVKDFSITWKIDKVIQSQDITTEPPKDHANGTQSVQSILKLPASRWNAYAEVSCEVSHRCSSKTQDHNIVKVREPKRPTVRILSPSDSDLSASHNSTLLCLITGFYPADISVHWELDQKRLDVSRFTNSPVGPHSAGRDFSMHSALTLLASGHEHGTFSCVVNHQSSSSPIVSTLDNLYASVTKTKPSVKILQARDELVCLAYEYSPSAISITWLLDGVTIARKHNITSPAKGPDGKFNVKSQLQVLPSEWPPGSVYTCQVMHITGTINHNISKAEIIEQSIYFDENMSEATTEDMTAETWNMACAFIALFLIALIYGFSVTLVRVKVE
ncbi:uncharacterized protein LOC118802491 [Colossoma macropomum]|uniref:uncharacterized protein LOC118802491 n=1 Tax=Colossoma macropomum TaxID=42526 RepID=UPI001864DB4E|nr:uncharacterized protein LOC118802491 [Colossoma macropomum]